MPSAADSVNGDEHGAALVGLWAEQTDNACSVFSQRLLHAFGDGHELEDSLSLLPSALKKEDTRGVCPGPAMNKPHKDSRVEICTAHVSYWFSILPLPPGTFIKVWGHLRLPHLGGCLWHLVGRGQRCAQTLQCTGQAPRQGAAWPQMSRVRRWPTLPHLSPVSGWPGP